MATGGVWDVNETIIFDIESSVDPKWVQTLGIQMLKSRGPVKANTQDVIYTLLPSVRIAGQALSVIRLHDVRDPWCVHRWCRDQWGDPGDLWGSLTFTEPQFRINEILWFLNLELLMLWQLTWNG